MNAMLWSGWGDPENAVKLAPRLRGLLEQALGVKPSDGAAVALEAVRLAPPALTRQMLEPIEAIVDAGNVRTTADDRVRHTRGKSTVDLLRIRAGEAEDAPDAVVLPGSHDEVVEVLRICAGQRIAVVPFGGGTSVVGGLAPAREGFAGVVSLDLGRMDRLLSVDPVSRIATLEPGVRAPAAERLLGEHNFTLGHFPQSFEYASIGGFAATRSSGQYSAGYGRFDEMVVGLRVATPRGSIELGRAPRSAAGPDLRQLFLGSEGTLGVITAVTVSVRPAPAERICEGWRFASFEEGIVALRRLAQDGPVPTMLRLSDDFETTVNALSSGATGFDGGCLAVVGYEGKVGLGSRPGADAVLQDAGGVPLGTGPGEAWLSGRFQAPYLRDALLDAGAIAETVETATFWSGLSGLYESVRDSLISTLAAQGTPPMVLCHISHVYAAGASLYFTVVCAATDDPVSQWRQAKEAVNTAILAAGGTITHHHAVGTDHAAALAEEIGPLALDALRAVKRRLDPTGILNPGILLDDAERSSS
jgi:alkyldihydroxyacetonephosphate synthase